MPKLIIHYDQEVAIEEALALVQKVVDSGRVSKGRGGIPKFCHVSRHRGGGKDYTVITRDRKPTHYPDSFVVSVSKEQKDAESRSTDNNNSKDSNKKQRRSKALV